MNIFEIRDVVNIITGYSGYIMTNEWNKKYKYLLLFETDNINDIDIECEKILWCGKNVDLSNTKLTHVDICELFNHTILFPKTIKKIILDVGFTTHNCIPDNMIHLITWKKTRNHTHREDFESDIASLSNFRIISNYVAPLVQVPYDEKYLLLGHHELKFKIYSSKRIFFQVHDPHIYQELPIKNYVVYKCPSATYKFNCYPLNFQSCSSVICHTTIRPNMKKYEHNIHEMSEMSEMLEISDCYISESDDELPELM